MEALQRIKIRDTCVAQLGHLTSAQVMISLLMGSIPTLGSVMTAQSLEPALDSVSPSFPAPPPLTFCLSLKNKQTLKKLKIELYHHLTMQRIQKF